MMSLHLTKAEVDFMLEISHYQDESGRIYGVYYKDISKAIGVSSQTFYVTMYSLVEKGLICLKEGAYGDRDIIIHENDFTYPDALKEGYLSTGHDIFYNDAFKKLKGKEKLLALYFIMVCGNDKKYYIGVNKFFKEFGELLNVSKRTIRVYLGHLRAFFSIGIKNKMYWIRPLKSVFKDKAPKDITMLSNYLGRVACRRNKACYTFKDFKETINLIKQYSDTLKERTASIFLKAVDNSIKLSNIDIPDKNKWNRQLDPKFIHKQILRTI